jgi:hypothetical protein
LQASLETPPSVTPEEEKAFLTQFDTDLAGDFLVDSYKEFSDKLKKPS